MVITTKLQHVVLLTFERINPAIGISEAVGLSCAKKVVKKKSEYTRSSVASRTNGTTLVEASSLNTFKNRLDKLWVRNGIMYDPDVDLHATTSARRTRYETMGVC